MNRQTNFGTLDDPLALIIFYNGEEKDKYSTFFNSLSVDFKPNQRDTYTFNTSFYNTNEKEYFEKELLVLDLLHKVVLKYLLEKVGRLSSPLNL